MSSKYQKNAEQPLLTEKSLALALSPPRVAPLGSAHRAMFHSPATDPSRLPFIFHRSCEYSSSLNSPSNLYKRRLRDHIFRRREKKVPTTMHPHISEGSKDHHTTRFIGGTLLPTSWHNYLRDSGRFRSIADSLVTLSAPSVGLSSRRAVGDFVRLTRVCRRHKYGSHERQIIEVFLPDQFSAKTDLPSRLLFFVHGGAWGSGVPWFYRLVAAPFVEIGMAVAIVGYRTYPCGRLEEQVNDCVMAAKCMEQQYPEICRRTVVMGHSSGAHCALLMVFKLAMQRLAAKRPQSNDRAGVRSESLFANQNSAFQIEQFVGISGPYNISHHFDYEASRGVEELSPMKPVCGYTREFFRRNSPALRLQDTLVDDFDESKTPLDEWLPPLTLVHGIEDDTVPFTSTADAARTLRCCGLTRCSEIYVAETGHQEAIMQVMLGGKTRDTVMELLENPERTTAHGKTLVKIESKL